MIFLSIFLGFSVYGPEFNRVWCIDPVYDPGTPLRNWCLTPIFRIRRKPAGYGKIAVMRGLRWLDRANVGWRINSSASIGLFLTAANSGSAVNNARG